MGFAREETIVIHLRGGSQRKSGVLGMGIHIVGFHSVAAFRAREVEAVLHDQAHVRRACIEPALSRVDSTTVIVDAAAQVVVPAGTFPSCVVTSETISVNPSYNNGVYVEEYRRYFAPAVGLVKVTARWRKGATTVGELLA
jgi:hypothetical protein